MARTGKAKDAKLTAKQQRVAKLVNEGNGPSDIAKTLGISPNGVQMHIRRIEAKGIKLNRKRRSSNGRKRTASSNGRSTVNGLPSAEQAVQAVNDVLARTVGEYDERLKSAEAEAEELVKRADAAEEEVRTLRGQREQIEQRRLALTA